MIFIWYQEYGGKQCSTWKIKVLLVSRMRMSEKFCAKMLLTSKREIPYQETLFLHSWQRSTAPTKGQLNSELIYGDINFPKQQQKCCEDICPDIFLQRPGSFLGLSGDLVSNIIINESYRKPKEASRAEILTLFLLPFWKIDVITNSF